MNRIKKRNLRKAKHEDLKRLARWLKLAHRIDEMSRKQLASLVFWLITRREKKKRDLTW